jgi:hypothetical protein
MRDTEPSMHIEAKEASIRCGCGVVIGEFRVAGQYDDGTNACTHCAVNPFL